MWIYWSTKSLNARSRQEPPLLGAVEGLVGVDGAEAGVELLLQPRLDAVRDHHIGAALRDLAEDGGVVGEQADRGLFQVGPVEPLVTAARVDHDPHVRPVDGRERRACPRRRSARLPPCRRGRWGSRRIPPLAVERDRHAARRHVELTGAEIGQQGRPTGLDVDRLGTERLGEACRQVDVDAEKVPVAASRRPKGL